MELILSGILIMLNLNFIDYKNRSFLYNQMIWK